MPCVRSPNISCVESNHEFAVSLIRQDSQALSGWQPELAHDNLHFASARRCCHWTFEYHFLPSLHLIVGIHPLADYVSASAAVTCIFL